MLITFEGLDGTGKTTLLKEIAKYANSSIITKEPGSPFIEVNQSIRRMVLENVDLAPLERELLFYADASQHKTYIEKNKDKLILSDRGLLSHLAYLRGYLKTKAIDFEDYSLCRALIKKCCATPDLIVYLSGSVELMRVRTAGKEKDAIEQNGHLFYHHVLETYKDLVNNDWQEKCLVLDATSPIDENITRVLSYLQEEGNEILFKELRD